MKPAQDVAEEQEEEIFVNQPEPMETQTEPASSPDESADENDSEDDTPEVEAGAEADGSENEGDENEPMDEDEVDFSKLTGIGTADNDDSDVEEMLRVVKVSDLPAQTLSLARNDEPALDAALKRIALFDTAGRHGAGKLPFRESLSVRFEMEEAMPAELAAKDLERERRFAELATGAVHEGLARLRTEKIKFRRPDDYFAQMIKTDTQMTRVKAHLLAQRDSIRSAERRKFERDGKDGKKERKAQRLAAQERNKKTKEEIEATTKLRKERVKRRGEQGIDSDDEFPIEVLDAELLDPNSKEFASLTKKPTKKVHWKNVDDAMDKSQRGGRRGDRRNKNPGGPSGINKKRGSKKRLGKNRRKVAVSKAGNRG